jgi:alkylation response protein AidB-like acyl-CoA dehydrogenase
MNFELTDDQKAFADMAAGLFADYCGDEQLRAHDDGQSPFMQDLWKQCITAGLHTVLVPQERGGLGLGLTELMGILEQQGRALALLPLWEQQVGLAALDRFGVAAPEGLWQALLHEGSPLALSLSALSDSRGAGLQVQQSGGAFVMHGRAQAVGLGQSARFALLTGSLDGQMRLLMVDLDASGVTRTTGRTQHHLEVADLDFHNCPLAAWQVLPEAALPWVAQRAAACLAALQLGVTQAHLRRTVDYVSERQQFGRAIGSFQLVSGQMADGYIALEALRSALWQLVYRLDAGLGAAPQALATRVLANDAGHFAGHMAQHVHGGIGVDLTYPIHRFLYWSRALGAALGGSEHQLAALGDWLASHDALGWKYDAPEDGAAQEAAHASV